MSERAGHWAELQERGAAWGPVFLGFLYRILGRTVCLAAMAPVIPYFYLAAGNQRRASLAYLERVWRVLGRSPRPGHWQGLQHFFAFGDSLIDRLGAWIGRIDRRDLESVDSPEFDAMRADARGALILSGHIGATEIVRAVASRHQRRRVNIVTHTAQTANYNALIAKFAPQSQVFLIQASDFGVATAMAISAAVERGEWVVIMGDRVSMRAAERVVHVNFLGERAALPQGPFQLAVALRCPVYSLFCVKRNGRYAVRVSLLSDLTVVPRGGREAALARLVQRYSQVLEALVRATPYQWFNFYDFWSARGEAPPGDEFSRPSVTGDESRCD